MNAVTQEVIEFLGYPEHSFGTEEDVLLLAEPEALRARVSDLLDEPKPNWSADGLKERLGEADWPFIAQEFQMRVNMASRFFDRDALAPETAPRAVPSA